MNVNEIKLSSNVLVFEYPVGGVLYNFSDGKEYTIGMDELRIVQAIKKNNLSAFLNNNHDNNKKIQRIIERLYGLGLLLKQDSDLLPSKARLNEFRRFKMLQIRKEPVWFANFPFSLISMMILVLPLLLLPVTYFVSAGSRLDLTKIISFEIEYWPYYILGGIFGFIVPGIMHEFSHLITGKKCGCHVVEIGLCIRFVFACFYVRIAGISQTTKSQKIHIYLSGMLYNLSAGLISVLGICLFNGHTIIRWIFIAHFIANFEMILTNSMCFMNLDGDRVLQEITGDKSFFLRIKKIKSYERNILFVLVAICLCSLFISLNYQKRIIPYITHILSAIYIILSKRTESKCTLYCLLWQTYGYTSIIVYILSGWFYTWRNAISVGFILILAVNFFMVWFGTLFYLILKAIEKLPSIKVKKQ